MDVLEQKLQDDFVQWVTDRLSRIERRPNAWCPQWWAHPEAVDRLYALHQAWVKAQRTGTLISWWNYDWAIQWPTLTQPGGVLDGCSSLEHVAPTLPEMQFTAVPDGTDLALPFPPAGDHLDEDRAGGEDDQDEVERRLQAERAAQEEAILAQLMGDDDDPDDFAS
ncbi:DUF4913 domain-containing protein [Microbacteriaceae bacterium VKM Ac-2854]|nr:DUF4913 domain-containing protein [Microbacteriaceae bacterium VKM Ac-2854]